MPGLKAVVFAFAAFRKSGYSFVLPECMERRIPACQHFMNIALVTHVENQMICRQIEHAMDGDRQFDDTQIGSQMSTRFAHMCDQKIPDLLSQDGEGFLWQVF